MKSLGIVAGAGSLPKEIAQEAKKEGLKVHICAVKNEAEKNIVSSADSYEWVNVGELGKLIKYFQSKNVSKIVFGGKIHKLNLLKGEVRPDLEMLGLFTSIKDRKDDTLLGTIANHLTKKGLEVIDSTLYLKKSLPEAGLLTSKKLSSEDEENVKFGFETAKKIAGLDIGQTVVVKDMSVVAVESVEGTDSCIMRGGMLAGGPRGTAGRSRTALPSWKSVPNIGEI